MSHIYQQYRLLFAPEKPISLAFTGQYFLSLFSDYPVSSSPFSFFSAEDQKHTGAG